MAGPAPKRPAQDEASAPQAKRLRDPVDDPVDPVDVYRTMVDLNARMDALEKLLGDLKKPSNRFVAS